MAPERPVAQPPTRALAPRPSTVLRDRVIEQLSAAFAHGAMETEEFERRVTVAHGTTSTEELEGLLQDLGELAVVGSAAAAPQTALVPASQAPAGAQALSVFGSTTRAGRWSVPRRMLARAIFGNVELDFSDATLPAGPVELEVSAIFGNIEITVPPHLAVESEGNAVLGNFDHVHRAAADLPPDAPVLRIRGKSVFGNVEIGMRLPTRRRLP
jgi:hypothetical protein